MMCEVSLVGLEGLLILLVYWLYWMEWDGSCAAYRMNGQIGCTSMAYERLCSISNGIRMGIIWMAYRTAYWMAYRTAYWMAYWMAYGWAYEWRIEWAA